MKSNLKKRLKESGTGYLFILPQIFFFTVFVLYPVFLGFKMSLYEHSYQAQEYVGLENYRVLFKDPVFRRSILNTVFFVIMIVLLTIIFALFVSTTVFDKNRKYLSFIRTSYYLPVIVSMTVMSIIWNFFLNPSNGLITYLFSKMGVDGVNLLGNTKTVMWVIVFVTFFGNVGQAIILYIATMMGIPQDYFEAARIDGATRLQQIRHIILPLVEPVTTYLIVTNIVMVLKIFVVIQLLTGGGPNNASVTLMYLLYQHAFQYNNTGIAAAIGVLMFVIAVLLSIPQIRNFMKTDLNN